MRTSIGSLLWTVICFASSLTVVGQSGPGGVGSSSTNILWLDPNKESFADNTSISIWSDKSGNKNDAVQSVDANKPRYRTNSINGRSVIRFSGNQFLSVTANLLGANNPVTVFVVYRWISGPYAGFISNRRGDSNSPLLGIDSWQKPFPTVYAQAGHYGGNAINGPQLNNETAMISYVRNSATHRLFINSAPYSSGPVGDFYTQSITPTRIGSYRANDLSYHFLNGDIAEMILYKTSINDAERTVVENYLSAKYNLPIATANKYYSDNSNYNQDVQGIGTTNGTVKHSQAGNSKGLILTEVNSTLNAANEFVFAGHNTSANSLVNADPSNPATALSSSIAQRWQRSWYVQKSGTVDAKLSFDWSQAGLSHNNLAGDLSQYVLLYRPDLQSAFQPITDDSGFLVPLLENEDQIAFTVPNASLQNGYYTLGKQKGFEWTGAVSSEWNTAGNWSLNSVPTPVDHVIINTCSTCPVLSTPVQVKSMLVNGGNLSFNTFTLSATGGVRLLAAKLISTEGALQAADFWEVKDCRVEGNLLLRKTSNTNNAWFGNNTFRGKLTIVSQGSGSIAPATQTNDTVSK